MAPSISKEPGRKAFYVTAGRGERTLRLCQPVGQVVAGGVIRRGNCGDVGASKAPTARHALNWDDGDSARKSPFRSNDGVMCVKAALVNQPGRMEPKASSAAFAWPSLKIVLWLPARQRPRL